MRPPLLAASRLQSKGFPLRRHVAPCSLATGGKAATPDAPATRHPVMPGIAIDKVIHMLFLARQGAGRKDGPAEFPHPAIRMDRRI